MCLNNHTPGCLLQLCKAAFMCLNLRDCHYICQVEMSGTKGPISTFIVEPFVPHKDEYYLSIVSDRLGVNISFSECGGIDIEENWDKVN